MDNDKINMTRTIKALEAYDKANKRFQELSPRELNEEELSKLEKLAEEVGYAYGLDTSDRNNIETCRQCIRPGPSTPAPGFELSFVRRMARDFHDASMKPLPEPRR